MYGFMLTFVLKIMSSSTDDDNVPTTSSLEKDPIFIRNLTIPPAICLFKVLSLSLLLVTIIHDQLLET